MLTIWGRLNSHNVKKVVWLAEELALPYVRHDVGGRFGMDAAYRTLNPNALIPTIEDDGFVLWESNAILRYLAAKHGGERWYPADAATRAFGDRWVEWQNGFADAQRDAFFNLVRREPADQDTAAVARSAQATAKLMTILDAHLAEHRWLSGEMFGIGDIPMGVYAHTWFTLAIDRPDRPNVARWYAELRDRPGYAANIMIPLT
jgi:glutathione S-transferase